MANFVRVDGSLTEHRKVDDALNAPHETVFHRDECFTSSLSAEATRKDSCVNDVCYKSTFDRLEQIANNEAVKYKGQETSRKE